MVWIIVAAIGIFVVVIWFIWLALPWLVIRPHRDEQDEERRKGEKDDGSGGT